MKYQTEQIAAFALRDDYPQLNDELREQLKRHLLDALGSFVHALHQETPGKMLKSLRQLHPGKKLSELPADTAGQLYTALIRYPDFMDNYLGKESTCHPSDTIGPLLAVSHLKEISGEDFLNAMAVAYTVECRLVEEVPVMINGYDHTTLLAYAVVAGVARLLNMSEQETAQALGMAGCTYNPLVTSRASYSSEWKGFASSQVTGGCIQLCLMAANDMTGPIALFETPEKGFNDIYGMKLEYDWSKEDLSPIKKCCLKTYNAEVHTQTAIEALLEIREENAFAVDDVESIEVIIFLTGYHIVGGGEYGDRYNVHSKEQADHSLPYLLAVALLDGQVTPLQLSPKRIMQQDVQNLLKNVKAHTSFPLHKPVKLAGVLDKYTEKYPEKMCSKIVIHLKGGHKLEKEKEDFKGYYTRPLAWEDVVIKFKKMSGDYMSAADQEEIIEKVKTLETANIHELLQLLLGVESE